MHDLQMKVSWVSVQIHQNQMFIYIPMRLDDDRCLKLQNPGTNNKVGITLNTDNYGGYVRGFSDSTHSVHGTVIGAVTMVPKVMVFI